MPSEVEPTTAVAPPMAAPLAGLRVIDLTANMTGPLATMVLADQGAEVIKVEPPDGDVIRHLGTGRPGMSTFFANLNRSKRSLCLDLHDTRGVEVVRELAKSADVVMQNFRPGVIEGLGLGYDALRECNPKLIYVSITGFGRTGPLAQAPGYDHVVQALSGFAAIQAGSDGEPALVRQGVVDKVTGLMVAQAVLAAVFARGLTGRGQSVEVSMLDAALSFVWPDGMMNHTSLDPVDQAPPISRGFRLTRTADGYVALTTMTDAQWRGLIAATGLTSSFDDPELTTLQGRIRNGGRVMREVAKTLAQQPTEDVVARMAENDVPCSPVVSLDDLVSNAQVQANGCVEEQVHPVLGRIVQPRPPARFSGSLVSTPTPAPDLGADSEDVLLEVGFSPRYIRSLRSAGVVRGASRPRSQASAQAIEATTPTTSACC